MKHTLCLKNELNLDIIEKLVYWNYNISLDEECLRRVDKAANYIKKKAESGEVIYGFTTWFNAKEWVHRETIENLATMYNEDMISVVPSQWPSAHLF